MTKVLSKATIASEDNKFALREANLALNQIALVQARILAVKKGYLLGPAASSGGSPAADNGVTGLRLKAVYGHDFR